jgi:hypothetical protein
MSKWVKNIKKGELFDVYIGRPSKWGNPFAIGRDGNRAEVCAKHKAWFYAQPDLVKACKEELKGKTLGCYCAEEQCHGDTLASCANGEEV